MEGVRIFPKASPVIASLSEAERTEVSKHSHPSLSFYIGPFNSYSPNETEEGGISRITYIHTYLHI